MATFIYSPGIRVYIDTERNGLIDVSDDVTGGVLVRRVDGVSTFDFGIMNARRKYDGVFTPNDRIVVMMKRLTWLRVFTGYLNTVPLKTIWPKEVPLSATCSLKRLQYWYWDPANSNTQAMIAGALSDLSIGTSGLADQGTGGVMNVLLTILDKVTGWPASKVHIGKIPEDWYQIAIEIATDVERWASSDLAAATDYLASLNPGALWGGIDANASGLGGPEADWNAEQAGNVTLGPNGFANTLVSSSFDGKSVSAAQKRNAEIIMSTGWDILAGYSSAKGFEAHALATALAVSMQESSLLNLPSQKYPESSEFPHDTYADGSIPTGDHDSVGLFQQRNGWGTIAERMNPSTTATKFFTGGTSAGTPGLLDKDGWQDMSVPSLAQAVQVSAYPSAYAKWEKMAFAMVGEMIDRKSKKGAVPSAPNRSITPRTSRPPGQVTGRIFAETAVDLVQTWPSIPYTQQYGGTQVQILTQQPPPGLDCSSFVQWAYLNATGAIGSIPRRSSDQARWCQRITAEQALATPGALVFVSSNGAESGVHHVEMSLGDGQKTVGAHHTGVPASVASNTPSYWSFGGLVPNMLYNDGGGGVTPGSTGTLSGGTGHWPVTANQVTTPYGEPGTWAAGYHTGADFGNAETGDPVTNIAPGTVVQSGSNGDYGNSVTIQVGDYQVIYGHMSAIDAGAGVGAVLDTGAAIGLVGNTGRSYGDHLHLEVREAPYGYGDDVDPIVFLTEGMMSGSTGVTVPGGGALGFFGLTGNLIADTFDWPLVSETSGFNAEDPVDALFGTYAWSGIPSSNSQETRMADALAGSHALMNDTTLLPYVKNLFYSSMRSFCSAPNGDLIGWFPDYYGLWGTAGKLRLEPIEIMDFNVFWSDDNFVTHQFAQAGTHNNLDLASGSAETAFYAESFKSVATYGIANIDSGAVMSSLLGIKPKDAAGFTKWVYDKMGARPDFYQADGLVGQKAELFAAIHMFMIQWAYQYRAEIPLTFMPEAWPGMLVQAPAFDFQAYITTVTHTFQFGDGGKFETALNIAAPSYMPRGKADKEHALFGLPMAGGYSGRKALAPSPNAYENPDSPTYQEPDAPHQEITGVVG